MAGLGNIGGSQLGFENLQVPQQLAGPDLASLLGYGAAPSSTGTGVGSSPDYSQLLGLSGLDVTPPPAGVPTVPLSPQAAPTAPTSTPGSPPASTDLSHPATGNKLAAGQGVSVSGFSPGAYNTIHATAGANTARAISREQAQAEAGFAPITAEQHQATEAGAAAAAQVAQGEAAKIAGEANAKRLIGEAQDTYAAKEQTIIAQNKAEAASSLSDYRAALSDFAASGVNPSQLWDSGGNRGQFAMVATAFLHDFLGAKGIQTSGLDSIKQAIQNNISAQVANMNHKGEVAAGFKTVWDMQRAQSASDAEARQRVFGFYLQGLTNHIESTLGTYDSGLALAKGQAAIAKLQQEQVNNDLAVRTHIDQSANQRTANQVALVGHELAASSAKYAADQHFAAAALAAGAKGKNDPSVGLLADKGGTYYRRFLPDVEKATADKIRQSSQGVGQVATNIQTLIGLQDKIDSVPPGDFGALNRLQNEKARAAEQLRNIIKMGIIYDQSGKAINEQEVKLYDQLVGKKDWFLNGDNVRTLGILQKSLLDKNDAIVRGLTYEIGQDDPAFGKKAGDRQFAPAESTQADIQSSDGAGRHTDSQAEEVIKQIHAPDAGNAADLGSLPEKGPITRSVVQTSWNNFIQANPWAAPNPENQRDYDRRAPAGIFANTSDALDPKIPDKAFVSVVELAGWALAGDQRAAAELNRLAEGKPHTANEDGLLAAYAQWEKQISPGLGGK